MSIWYTLLMKKIIFVTNSAGKTREAQEILGKNYVIEHRKIDLDEIQTIDGKEVIKKKIHEAYRLLKQPVLVEDTSLYFDAWQGLPGALVRWFLDSVGCAGICTMLKAERNRKAYAESAIAFYDGKKLNVSISRLEGTVPMKPRGEYKFGWDPIFIPKGHKETFAQMGLEEKSKISMRKKALEKLKKHL